MLLKKGFTVLLCLALLFAVLSPVSASSDKTIRLAISADERTLNPYTYNTGYPGLDLVNLVYDNLFHLDENNLPQPWLVKEYQVSDDGLTYTFNLNEGVTWQDGQPLTAADVEFTINYYLQNPHARFTNPLKIIEKIEVIDDLTLTMKLTKPDAKFLLQPLADFPVLPKHIWSEITDPSNSTTSLGSGPYILEEYKANQYYTLKANPNYFKGKPVADRIVMPLISDSNAMYTALQAGQVDIISASITPELVEQFKSNAKLKVVNGPGYSTTLLQFNADKFPMSDKAFRQAVAYAIDTQYLVDTVTLGYATLGSPGFIHPASPFGNPNLSFDPNMDTAKKILDDAGFKDTNGDGFREDPSGKAVNLEMIVQSSSPLRLRSAEIITEWLNKIGLNVKVKSLDRETVVSLVWPEYDVTKGRNYDLALWGWSAAVQLFPDRLTDLFYSDLTVGSLNVGGYKNPEFDKLADQLATTFEENARRNIINQMQTVIADDFPLVTLYYEQVINAFNPNAYDGYVFQKGKGIVNKLSFISATGTEQTGAKEESKSSEGTSESSNNDKSSQSGQQAANQEDSGSSSTSLFILIGLIAAVLAGVYVFKKKSGNNHHSG